MSGLLDLMGEPPEAKRPVWRKGKAVAGSAEGYVPLQDGDLRWLSHDRQDRHGRWYRWSAREQAWCCIDPIDAMGINGHRHAPPAIKSAA
jgi:hypothetical protein